MYNKKLLRLGLLRFNVPEPEDDKDKNRGGGSGAPKGSPNVQGFITSKAGGDPIMAVSILLGERYQQRMKIRSLEADLATAGARAPKDGQRVLSKEDAEAFDAYKALGTPDEVKAKVDKSSELQGKLEEVESERQMGVALEAVGYKNQVVLKDLMVARGLKLELKEETKDGKQVKVPYVRPANDQNAAPTLLTSYVETNAKDYLVPLKGSGSTAGGPPAPNGSGLPFPRTAGSGDKPESTGDKVADRLAARQKSRETVKSPLDAKVSITTS